MCGFDSRLLWAYIDLFDVFWFDGDWTFVVIMRFLEKSMVFLLVIDCGSANIFEV
jgi:hypothetical protein